MHKSIIAPITQLRDHMNRASAGEYVPCDMHFDNEIGELVNGYNHLAEAVTNNLDQLQAANVALRDAEEHLQRDRERIAVSELRFKSATDLSTIVVFELMSFTDEFFCSDSWEAITSYPPMDIFPKEYIIRYIIHPDDRPKVLQWTLELNTRFDHDIRFLTTHGDYKWIHISMAQVEDVTTGVKKVVGTITDIHDRVLAQEKLTYTAYHESLTGLPRRILFQQEVEARLHKLKSNSWGVVYVVSMNNFKRINDIYGFTVGDNTICAIAAALRERFESEMYLSRNSGNSFLLYTECPRITSYVRETARHIFDLFSTPFEVEDLQIEVPVHLGAAMFPDHGRDVHELIRNADIAMHEARDHDSGCALFDSDMLYKVERNHQILEVLRNFETTHAMYVQYQPIVRSADRSCLGFEALMRMDTNQMGFISPGEFIPLSEQSKLIIPMGLAVLRESCRRTQELTEAGYDFHHVSVNVSSIQLEEDNFVDLVVHVLEETGLNPEKLQLEVTESMLISNLEVSTKKLYALQNMGITIALDDFGTGYSSMKYLRVIPLDVVKIDKHFVDEIEQGIQKLFAFTMIQLSHDIGLTVVAEGVETERQFNLLRDHGCDYIQGFYISHPLYSEDIDSFLNTLEAENRKNREA